MAKALAEGWPRIVFAAIEHPDGTGYFHNGIGTRTWNGPEDIFLTCSRASPALTYAPNGDGSLLSFAANVPRVTDLGLLEEDSATNLILRSQEFDNASWTKTAITVTANNLVGPDGSATADTVFETVANSIHAIYQQGKSVTSGTAYTASAYVKANGRQWIRVYMSAGTGGRSWFDLTNGVAGTNDAGNTSTITPAGNGWYRVTVTRTASATTTGECDFYSELGDGIAAAFVGDVTKGLHIFGVQFEAGSSASSYIPTTSVAVTRDADVVFEPTWYGTGTLGTISPVKHSSEIAIQDITFSLSGLDATVVSQLNDNVRNLNGSVWLGCLNPIDDSVVADPYQLVDSELDYQVLDAQENGTTTIQIVAHSGFYTLDRGVEEAWTPENQKLTYPTDTGMDMIPGLQKQDLQWTPT